MKWRVLVSAPYLLPYLDQYRARFAGEEIEIVLAPVDERLNEVELLPIVADLDGVICGDDQFTERVLLAAPRLKVISKWGTGIDSIDVNSASRLGIRVCRTPGAFTDPVADTTLGYILCFARQLPWMDRELRLGYWRKTELVSLAECSLGVIGVGDIGRAVVRRARAFGMTVLGTDPVPVPDSFIAETGIRMLPLRQLLAASDFVSLNCDLNPSSFHLIGREEMAAMRSEAYLINTARGPLVDEGALAVALSERWIAGAALDVFEVEPLPAGSPLRALNSCLLAPHNANSSPTVCMRVHESTIANLFNGLREVSRTART